MCSVLLIIGLGAVAWVKAQDTGTKPGAAPIVILLIALVVPVLGIAYAFKKKQLIYLGQDGAALYVTRGTRGDASAQIVRFADVQDVNVKNQDGGKGWTDWTMQFVDAKQKPLLTLKGKSKTFAGKVIHDTFSTAAQAIYKGWQERTGRTADQR